MIFKKEHGRSCPPPSPRRPFFRCPYFHNLEASHPVSGWSLSLMVTVVVRWLPSVAVEDAPDGSSRCNRKRSSPSNSLPWGPGHGDMVGVAQGGGGGMLLRNT